MKVWFEHKFNLFCCFHFNYHCMSRAGETMRLDMRHLTTWTLTDMRKCVALPPETVATSENVKHMYQDSNHDSVKF